MNGDLIMRDSILIHAPCERVWQILTDPTCTAKYMGSGALSDWQPGSPLTWEEQDGVRSATTGKGSIVEIQPGSFLSYTLLDPRSAVADSAENYLTITWKLKAAEEGALLTVTRGDYAKIAGGEERYREAEIKGGGWNSILLKVKQVAEEE
jgi:uncharacterized protein YndB with AHSA1/START domain